MALIEVRLLEAGERPLCPRDAGLDSNLFHGVGAFEGRCAVPAEFTAATGGHCGAGGYRPADVFEHGAVRRFDRQEGMKAERLSCPPTPPGRFAARLRV